MRCLRRSTATPQRLRHNISTTATLANNARDYTVTGTISQRSASSRIKPPFCRLRGSLIPPPTTRHRHLHRHLNANLASRKPTTPTVTPGEPVTYGRRQHAGRTRRRRVSHRPVREPHGRHLDVRHARRRRDVARGGGQRQRDQHHGESAERRSVPTTSPARFRPPRPASSRTPPAAHPASGVTDPTNRPDEEQATTPPPTTPRSTPSQSRHHQTTPAISPSASTVVILTATNTGNGATRARHRYRHAACRVNLRALPSGTGWDCSTTSSAAAATCTSIVSIPANTRNLNPLSSSGRGAAAFAASPVRMWRTFGGGDRFQQRQQLRSDPSDQRLATSSQDAHRQLYARRHRLLRITVTNSGTAHNGRSRSRTRCRRLTTTAGRQVGETAAAAARPPVRATVFNHRASFPHQCGRVSQTAADSVTTPYGLRRRRTGSLTAQHATT